MKTFRNLLEYVSRDIRFRAKLPPRFGSRNIWLSPGNHLAVLKPGERKFEAYLLGFVDRFVDSSSIVWDIGANMGIFSLPAAHKASFTLAIEPDPFNLELLHKTLAANVDVNWEVLPAAVAECIGTAKFNIPIRGRSANGLDKTFFGTQTGGIRQQFTVLTVTADWILERYPPPTFIKIDAEGAEVLILSGAHELLSRIRPAIVIEMPKENAVQSKNIFDQYDYATFSSYTAVKAEDEIMDISSAWDVLAIPREAIPKYIGR